MTLVFPLLFVTTECRECELNDAILAVIRVKQGSRKMHFGFLFTDLCILRT